MDGETPGRVINDVGMRLLIPFLEGPGTIVELGGTGNYYRNFCKPGQCYEVTNLDSGDRIVDMTAMTFDDNSVDAFVSMFALEHVYRYEAAINESFRCLKPRGRMLLAVPFMYYFHGAPSDYFRFTRPALDKLLSRFTVLTSLSLGNREMAISQFYHEKRVLGSKHSWPLRAALRLACLPFLAVGLNGEQHDEVFAITHLYLCEKPRV